MLSRAERRKGYENMKAMKTLFAPMQRKGRGSTTKKQPDVPILTITSFDYKEQSGDLHYIATDGATSYSLIMIVSSCHEMKYFTNSAEYMEVSGIDVIVSGNEGSALNGRHTAGRDVRIVYAQSYVFNTFVQAEGGMIDDIYLDSLAG